MSIFIAGPVRPLYFVIKSQVYLKRPLQISRFFSVTRMYLHLRWDVREAIFKVTRVEGNNRLSPLCGFDSHK